MFNVKDRVTSAFTGNGIVTECSYSTGKVLVLFDGVLGERWWEAHKLVEIAHIRVLRKAVKTDTACDFKCWDAVVDTCRCNCAGANHGIARDPARVVEYHLLLIGDRQ